jgi:DHA3 family macrolide efflux protein-like MFS transporter
MTDKQGVASAWSNSNFMLYIIGKFIADIAHIMAALAVMWLLMEITGSTSTASFSMLVSFVPSLLVAPFAGVVLDRVNKRRSMQVIDLLRGFVALAMGSVMLFGLPELWMVILYFFLRSLGDTFYRPASQAIIPFLVDKEQLVQANGIEQSTLTAGGILGPMVGALLIAAFGYSAVFFVDAFGFLVSVITLGLVKVNEVIESRSSKQGYKVSTFLGEIKEGLLYIKQKSLIVHLMILFSIVNFSSSALGVMLPFFINERFADGGIAILAQINTAAAIGGLCITLGVSMLKRMPYRGKVIIGSMLIFQFSQVLFGFTSSLPLLLLLAALRSVSAAGGMASSAIYQSEVEPQIRGRVFAFRSMLSTALTPFGVALAGIAGEFMPAWMVISLFGVIGTLAALGAMFSKELCTA